MRRLLLIALIAALAAGCGKPTSGKPELQENTEAYFAAHGIVQGQPNELRIGGTLFRFPAGVGLNPYTAQETYRSKDGSPMTLSTKEGLEQGFVVRERPEANGLLCIEGSIGSGLRAELRSDGHPECFLWLPKTARKIIEKIIQIKNFSFKPFIF